MRHAVAVVSIDELLDAATQRTLTEGEFGLLVEELRANDQALATFFNRCQLECDLHRVIGQRAAAELPLVHEDSFADQFEDDRLPRPIDGTQ
jgi:hypothetical protein